MSDVLPKIDSTDVRIVKYLLKESRTSFTDIAKDCKITVAAVRKRYQRLYDVGLINGAIMQINPHSLGYDIIADLGILTAIDNETQIIDFLLQIPCVVAIHPMGFGKYALGVTIAVENVQKLSTILEKIEAHEKINRVDTLIWAEVSNMDHGENFLIESSKGKFELEDFSKEVLPSKKVQETELDEKDKEILKILMQNSRTPFNKISKEVGISTISVMRRYKKLRENVITLSTITVDLRKLGYKCMVHLFIKVKDRSKVQQIHSQLLEIPNLIVAIRIIGNYDFRTIIAIGDFPDIFVTKEKIRRISGIEEMEVFLEPIFWVWPLNVFAPLIDPTILAQMSNFLKTMR